MVTKIPKEQAIVILRERISELMPSTLMSFNHKAWKDRTMLDLKQIFPTSEQSLQLFGIDFHTFITSEQATQMREAKTAARALLSSYINYIEDYSKIEETKIVIKEKDYEEKYTSLVSQYNTQRLKYVVLMDEHSELLNENTLNLNQIADINLQHERELKNTIQFENITLSKLLKVAHNIPATQLWGLGVIIIGLIVGVFSLGLLVEGTKSNNESFDLKTENKELRDFKSKLEKEFKVLNTLVTKKNDTIQNLLKTVSQKDTAMIQH